MSPSSTAPVPGSRSQYCASNSPGESSFIGKLSTSVASQFP